MCPMKRILVALVASWLGLALAPPAEAAAAYGTPYTAGPKGGDAHTFVEADPQSGQITILQHNTRQAAFVNCAGKGPWATLVVTHPVDDPVSAVQISYAEANTTEHVVMNAVVTGSSSGWLGHGASLGPKVNENGAIDIPLQATPAPGETLTITFGLQVHAGCLPYPILGLPGSRFVEGGKATFPSVQVG
jgi:hypothetical protein